MGDDTKLIPNPYRRSPIKDPELLAGRSKELKQIDYYVSLTASGQNPHVALIGARGVGKTSLLNVVQVLAVQKRLVVVRLDLNESKALSAGRYWHDFYASLCLAAARFGCWGGVTSPLYSALFSMLHSRRVPELDKVILQFPFALANRDCSLDEFPCPDALIADDLETSAAAVRACGGVGIIVLIDEGDCFGANRPLLQMVRNVFQSVNGCSLILSGTDAIFPTLSEVFSPIPRQFFRIDVKPFRHVQMTYELVYRPLGSLGGRVGPEPDTVESLHELCGGEPSELQLYCHHMYRQVEEGRGPRMRLLPDVFRAVLNEYRATTVAAAEDPFSRIERLPDRLLYGSKWLRYRKLNVAEATSLEILRRELALGTILAEEERAQITGNIAASYEELYENGVSLRNDRIELAGGELAARFWKSFVEFQKRERWEWNESEYDEVLGRAVVRSLGKVLQAIITRSCEDERDTMAVLETWSSGKPLATDDLLVGADLLALAAIRGRVQQRRAVEVFLRVDVPGRTLRQKVVCLTDRDEEATRADTMAWLEDRAEVLDRHGVSLQIEKIVACTVPRWSDVRALWSSLGVELSEGSGELDRRAEALEMFAQGNVEGAADVFRQLVKETGHPEYKNDLAYCSILLGQLEGMKELLEEALADRYQPIWDHNLAMVHSLAGAQREACNRLKAILEKTKAQDTSNLQTLCMLVLEPGCIKVRSRDGVPVDAACVLNLVVLGGLSPEEGKAYLTQRYPSRSDVWLSWIGQE